MDMNALRQERIQLIKDAAGKTKKPSRIPYVTNILTWKIPDAGYKLSEALFDYEIMEKVNHHAYQKYEFDAHLDVNTRNPLRVTTLLGNDEYVINDEISSINIHDQCFMDVQDYDELISDPKKYLWEVILPRKYKKLQSQENSSDFRKAISEFNQFGQHITNMTNIMNEEYGIPTFTDSLSGIPQVNSYEIMFNFLRGIKGVSYDIRRNLPKLFAAIEALDELFINPSLSIAKSLPKGTNPDTVVDGWFAMLGHSILSAKQFEKIYWPHLKRIAQLIEENDKLLLITAQGDSERFYDFFRELPKGHAIIHTELNDVFKMKKLLPNITIAGGVPIDLLRNGTEQECIDYIKKLIDELGYDGSYILSENKIASFTNDCKSENLKAISDYIKKQV